MENENIEIFGSGNERRSVRCRRGYHLTCNLKHGNTYMSHDLAVLLFGPDAKEGKAYFIHSKIEDNWYIAAYKNETLFNGGFNCVLNDAENKESVFRINGAQKVTRMVIESLVKEDEIGQRYVLDVSPAPKEYEGMNLYKITIK